MVKVRELARRAAHCVKENVRELARRAAHCVKENVRELARRAARCVRERELARRAAHCCFVYRDGRMSEVRVASTRAQKVCKCSKG